MWVLQSDIDIALTQWYKDKGRHLYKYKYKLYFRCAVYLKKRIRKILLSKIYSWQNIYWNRNCGEGELINPPPHWKIILAGQLKARRQKYNTRNAMKIIFFNFVCVPSHNSCTERRKKVPSTKFLWHWKSLGSAEHKSLHWSSVRIEAAWQEKVTMSSSHWIVSLQCELPRGT